MAYSESILTLTYDFMKYLIPVLSKYPRDQKFTLGERIQNLAHEILDDFITAYYSKRGEEKINQLNKANIKLEFEEHAFARRCSFSRLLKKCYCERFSAKQSLKIRGLLRQKAPRNDNCGVFQHPVRSQTPGA